MAKKKDKYYYDKASVYEEAIKALRTNIQFSGIDHSVKKMVVTSSFPSEGKTTISYELAKSFAQAGFRVLLMDCDLRNPSLGKIYGEVHSIGITSLLLKKAEFSEAVLAHKDVPGLWILMSGPVPPNPSELLSSQVFKSLVQTLEGSFDYVIFDTPPIGLLTDAAILSTIADGVVLVVKSGETKKEQVKASIDRIEHVGGKVLGAVLTHVKTNGSAYHSKYYNQYY